MIQQDILDEVIAGLDPDDIPVEFIIMAQITDFDGDEYILRGGELEDFLQCPFDAAEIRVVLDVRKIRSHVFEVASQILEAVENMVANRNG